MLAAGERIAEITGNEAATITSGASGGLVIQAAAAMTKQDGEVEIVTEQFRKILIDGASSK
ncbi:MAG: hypothetical protein ACKVJL_03290 [Dehalococcoidia bacterium]